jgi:hypothetical protein
VTEILYRIAANEQRFEAWAKKKKKNLEGRFLDMFNAGYNETASAPFYTKASFVCFWEIHENNSLAKVAPSITQASMMHLAQRLVERGRMQEAEIAHNLMINFVRLLSTLEQPQEGEENEEE